MAEKINRSASIPATLANARLDKAASALFPEYSRARLQTWITQGALTVEGVAKKPKDKVQAGETLQLTAVLSSEIAWQGQSDLNLTVVYEDNDILVLNKAAGVVVHPAAGHAENTLVNAILHHAPECEHLPRAGIIHRLDKDTSGLLVVAKSLPAHTRLVQMMHAREIKRIYQALVQGKLISGGTVDAPMGRHPKQRKKMAVIPLGKPAITHYTLLKKYDGFTLLRVQLETGRTHQIRVHMAHKQNPLVGDPVYGGRPKLPKGCPEACIHALQGFKRQALHAWRLSFDHPITHAPLSFEAPLPEDMQALLDELDAIVL